MHARATEFSVGLFLILGIGALLMLALKVSSVNAFTKNDTYELSASFENVGGLKVKAPVKVGGVLIGRVTEIVLDKEFLTPVVKIAVLKDYANFPSESSAAILTAGLLGEQFISITPGGDDDLLSDGDTIEDTQSAIVLEELIGKFMFNEGGSTEL